MTTSPPAPAASTASSPPPVSNKTAGHKVEEARGSSYGPTIKLILDQERARKTSLESRGAAIITTSGALATLLTGLVTFTRGNVSAFHLAIDKNAVWALIAAAVSFGLAAVLGLAANLPLFYEEADPDILEARVKEEEWGAFDPIEAARWDAELLFRWP